MKVLLTGASGFVGKRLVNYLLEHTDFQLELVVRKQVDRDSDAREKFTLVSDMSPETDWRDALVDCQVVIHAAARVHVMNDSVSDPLAEYRKMNVESTLNLARQAISNGVKRFIYLSSIKVNGESTAKDNPFQADDFPMPQDPYAISKYEAEQGLLALAKNSGLEVVIIRPALVYGPGVKGNFQQMLYWLEKGVPLPLGFMNNQRSLVSIDNLVSLITVCVTHPHAVNQIFLVSDGADLSTTELLRKLNVLLEKRVLLLPVPCWAIKIAARLMGKQAAAARLCGTLKVDINKNYDVLGWRPVTRVDDALRSTVQSYKNNDDCTLRLERKI